MADNFKYVINVKEYVEAQTGDTKGTINLNADIKGTTTDDATTYPAGVTTDTGTGYSIDFSGYTGTTPVTIAVASVDQSSNLTVTGLTTAAYLVGSKANDAKNIDVYNSSNSKLVVFTGIPTSNGPTVKLGDTDNIASKIDDSKKTLYNISATSFDLSSTSNAYSDASVIKIKDSITEDSNAITITGKTGNDDIEVDSYNFTFNGNGGKDTIKGKAEGTINITTTANSLPSGSVYYLGQYGDSGSSVSVVRSTGDNYVKVMIDAENKSKVTYNKSEDTINTLVSVKTGYGNVIYNTNSNVDIVSETGKTYVTNSGVGAKITLSGEGGYVNNTASGAITVIGGEGGDTVVNGDDASKSVFNLGGGADSLYNNASAVTLTATGEATVNNQDGGNDSKFTLGNGSSVNNEGAKSIFTLGSNTNVINTGDKSTFNITGSHTYLTNTAETVSVYATGASNTVISSGESFYVSLKGDGIAQSDTYNIVSVTGGQSTVIADKFASINSGGSDGGFRITLSGGSDTVVNSGGESYILAQGTYNKITNSGAESFITLESGSNTLVNQAQADILSQGTHNNITNSGDNSKITLSGNDTLANTGKGDDLFIVANDKFNSINNSGQSVFITLNSGSDTLINSGTSVSVVSKGSHNNITNEAEGTGFTITLNGGSDTFVNKGTTGNDDNEGIVIKSQGNNITNTTKAYINVDGTYNYIRNSETANGATIVITAGYNTIDNYGSNTKITTGGGHNDVTNNSSVGFSIVLSGNSDTVVNASGGHNATIATDDASINGARIENSGSNTTINISGNYNYLTNTGNATTFTFETGDHNQFSNTANNVTFTFSESGNYNLFTNTGNSTTFTFEAGGNNEFYNTGENAKFQISGSSNYIFHSSTGIASINAGESTNNTIINSGTGVMTVTGADSSGNTIKNYATAEGFYVKLGDASSSSLNVVSNTGGVKATVYGGTYSNIYNQGDSAVVTVGGSSKFYNVSGGGVKVTIGGDTGSTLDNAGSGMTVTITSSGNYITNTGKASSFTLSGDGGNYFYNSVAAADFSNTTIYAAGGGNHITNAGAAKYFYISLKGSDDSTNVVSNTTGSEATIISGGYANVYNAGSETTISLSGGNHSLNNSGISAAVSVTGGDSKITNSGGNATFSISGAGESGNAFYNTGGDKVTVNASVSGSIFSNTAAAEGFYISVKGFGTDDDANTIYNIATASQTSIIVADGYNNIYDYGSATRVTLSGGTNNLTGTGAFANVSNSGASAYITLTGANDTLVNDGVSLTAEFGGSDGFITNTGKGSTFTFTGNSNNIFNSETASTTTLNFTNAYNNVIDNKGTELMVSLTGGSGTNLTSSANSTTVVSSSGSDTFKFSLATGDASLNLSGAYDTIVNDGNITVEATGGHYFVSNTANAKTGIFTLNGGYSEFNQYGATANATIYADSVSNTIVASASATIGSFYVSLTGSNNYVSNTAITNASVIADNGYNTIISGGNTSKITLNGSGHNEISNTGKGSTFIVNGGNNSFNNKTSATNDSDKVQITIEGGSDTFVNEGGIFAISVGGGVNNVISNTATAASTIYGALGEDKIYNRGASSFITLGGGDTLYNFSDASSAKIVVSGTNVTNTVYNSATGIEFTAYNGSVYLENLDNGSNSKITLASGDFSDTIINKATKVSVNTGAGFDIISNTANAVTFTVGGTVNFYNYDNNASDVKLYGSATATDTNSVNYIYNTATNGNSFYVSMAGGNNYISSTGKNSTFIVGDGSDTIYNSGSGTSITLGGGNDSLFNIGTAAAADKNANSATVVAGAGNNYISLDYANGSKITIGSGNNEIYSKNSVKLSITSDTGGGNNLVSVVGGDSSTFTFGAGSDTLYISGSSVVADMGDGYASVVNDGSKSKFTFGEGNVYFTSSGGASNTVLASVGDDHFANISNDGGKFYVSLGGGNNNVISTTGVAPTIIGSSQSDTIYNGGQSAFITLTGGDTFYNVSGAHNASVSVGSGDNLIYNYGSNTTVDASAAVAANANTIYNYNNAASSTFKLGSGNDTIYNEALAASIYAEAGDNYISNTGTSALITVKGTGSSTFINTGNSTTMLAAAGSETFTNFGSYVSINAGGGDNSITSKASNVTITGGDGSDTVINEGGSSFYVNVGGGNNTVYSTVLSDGGKNATHYTGVSVEAGDGNDLIHVYNPGATINAGKGQDTVVVYGGSARSISGGGDVISFNSDTTAATKHLYGLSEYDTIKLDVASTTVKISAVAHTRDLNVTFGDQTLNVANARNQLINIQDKDNKAVTFFNDINVSEFNTGKAVTVGTENADFVSVVADGNVADGGKGNDYIYIRGNGKKKATAKGGLGNDTIYSDNVSVAALDGGAGDDLIITEKNTDNTVTIIGGRGDDTIKSIGDVYYNSGTNTYETYTVDNNNVSVGTVSVTYNSETGVVTYADGTEVALTGGRTIVYREGDGNDTVLDFKTGEGGDTLNIVGDYSIESDTSGKVLVRVGVGSIKLANIDYSTENVAALKDNIGEITASTKIGYNGSKVTLGIADADDDEKTLTYNYNSTTVYVKSTGIDNVNTDITVAASGNAGDVNNKVASTVNVIDATQAIQALKITGRTDSATTIHGGYGNDYIIGGHEDDVIYGGGGADTFEVSSDSGKYSIKDFSSDDVIKLANSNTILVQGTTIDGGIELTFGSGTSRADVESKTTIALYGSDLGEAHIKIIDGRGSETQLQYGVTSYTVGYEDATTLDFRTTPLIKNINANDHSYNKSGGNTYSYNSTKDTVTGKFASRVIYLGDAGAYIYASDTSSKGLDTIYGGTGADTISVSSGANYVIYSGDSDTSGAESANKIYATAGKNTIYGGTANDTFSGGDSSSNTYIIKADGGDDVITALSTKDTIFLSETGITAGTFTTVRGGEHNTVKFTLANDSNTLTIDGVSTLGTYITIFTSDTTSSSTSYQQYGASTWVASAEDITLNTGNKIDLTANAAVVTLDASQASVDGGTTNKPQTIRPDVYIIGNSGNNYLVAGQSNTTLYGAGGNDTLVGNTADTAKVTFVHHYNDGDTVIKNYNSNSDTIVLGDIGGGSTTTLHEYTVTNSAMNVSVDSKTGDVIINVMSGTKSTNTLTIKDAEGELLTFQYGSDAATKQSYRYYYDNKFMIDDYNSGTMLTGLAATDPTSGTAQGITATHTYISAENFGTDVDANSTIGLAITAVGPATGTKGVTIVGGKGNDTITGSSKADSIKGGAGANVIYGGGGNDTLVNDVEGSSNTFVFNDVDSGKTVVIEGYNSDTDKIQLASGVNVSVGTLKNNDVTLTIASGTTKATVSLKDAKNKAIHVVTVDDAGKTIASSRQVYGGDRIDADSSTMFTKVYNATDGYEKATATYVVDATANATVKWIVASDTATAGDEAWSLVGNAIANTIIAGNGGSTINGGAGNDSLVGGEGSDVFVFGASSGNNTIKGFNAVSDTIYFAATGASIKSITAGTGNNTDTIIFTLNNNTTINVQDGDGKEFTFGYLQSDNTTFATESQIYYGSTLVSAANIRYSSTLVVDVTKSTNVKNIDVSNTALTPAEGEGWAITGNANANSIRGGNGNDTFYGGTGNDTLTGGEGSDVFVFNLNEGNNVITDYTAGQDVIRLEGDSTTISASAFSSNAVTFTIGKNNGSIKVNNVTTDTRITVIHSDGHTDTQVYGQTNWKIGDNDGTSDTTIVDLDLTANTAVITLDASARNTDVNITGNAKANYLLAGNAATTLYGGRGNTVDTLDGGTATGTGKAVTFMYKGTSGNGNSDGNDIIVNYNPYRTNSETGDVILLESGYKLDSSKVTVNAAGDVIATVVSADNKSAGTITIKNGKGLIRFTSDTNLTDIVTLDAINPTDWYATDSTDNPITMDGTKGDDTVKTYFDAITRRTGTPNSTTGVIMTSQNDKITMVGGAGNDTLVVGNKTATLTGKGGDDTFFITDSGTSLGGGTYVITDYKAGEDVIKLDASTTLTSAATVSGSNDIKFTITNSNKKTSTITVKDAKDNAVSFIYGDGTSTTQVYNQTTVTLSDASYIKADKFDATANSLLKNINVSGTVQTETYIVGNANANVISVQGAANKNYTLDGGAGNDTLYGAAKDLTNRGIYTYVLSDGTDVIQNYTPGKDILYTDASHSIKSAAHAGTAVVLTTANNAKVSVVGAIGEKITVSDTTAGESTFIYYSDATITPKDNQVINSEVSIALSGNVKNVIGTSLSSETHIIGNSLANSIVAGANGTTLEGGLGNDTLVGGDGADVFVFNAGDGADVIVGYNIESDTIVLGPSTTFVSGTFDRTGATLTIGKYVKNTSGDTDTYKLTTGQGTIKVNGISGSDIKIVSSTIDDDMKVISTETTYIYNASAPTITSANLHGGNTYDASRSLGVKNITAGESNVKYIIGNNNANAIYASDTAITIAAGKGNDTIYASTDGTESQTFVFGSADGANVIVGYNADRGDVISLGAGLSLSTVDTGNNAAVKYSGNDVILTVMSGGSKTTTTITVKEGKGQIAFTSETGKAPTTLDFVASTDYFIKSNDVTASTDKKFTADTVKTWIDAQTYRGEGKANSDTGVYLIGNNAKVSIIGGAGDDTLEATKAAAYLKGNGGADVFYYSESAATVSSAYTIGDYNSDEGDIIKLGNNVSLTSSATVSGGGVKFTVKDGNKTGSITVNDGSNPITFVTYDGTSTTQIYNKTAVTLEDDTYIKNKVFDATANSLLRNINVSGTVQTETYIVGNANANVISVQGADDTTYTLDGGAGNDTLYGSDKGDYVYVLSDGTDVIVNYKEGDILYSADDNYAVKSMAVSGNDLVLTTNKGKVTLKNSKDKQITFSDTTSLETIRFYSDPINITVNSAGTESNSGTYVIDGTIDVTKSAGVKTINAGKVESAVNIIGNANANIITAAQGGGTIAGGGGNDVITLGEGSDTVYFTAGDGADIVNGFNVVSDTIVLGPSTTFVSSAIGSGKDSGTVTLTIGQIYAKGGNGSDSDTLLVKNNGTIKLNNIDGGTFNVVGSVINDKTISEGNTFTVFTNPVETASENHAYDYSQHFGVSTIIAGAEASGITANKNNNLIDASAATGEIQIAAGAGNDTIIAADKGSTTIVFNTSVEGSNVIENYNYSKDVISLGAGMSLMSDQNLKTNNFKGENAVVTIYSGTKTVGTVTLAKGQVSVIGGTEQGLLDYVLDTDYFVKDDEVAADGDSVDVESKYTYINAEARRTTNADKDAYINAQANTVVVIGGKGDDTLVAAKNATLTGGDGEDVFYYSDEVASVKGAYVITDYTVGEDTIKLGENVTLTAANTVKSGNDFDVRFTVMQGRNTGYITVKDALGKYITISDTTAVTSQIYTETEHILGDSDGTYFDATANSLLMKITASSTFASDTFIIGNAKNNTISVADIAAVTASEHHYTLNGGAGNDLLIGTTVEGSSNTFVVGTGNDVIRGYKEGDVIYVGDNSITSGEIKKFSSSRTDLIITVGKSKVTLEGAGSKKITFSGTSVDYTTKFYGDALMTAEASDIEKGVLNMSGSDKVKNIDASGLKDDNVGIGIIGNKNANSIKGTSGDDTIDGGAGNDTFTGGDGHDTFIVDYGTGNKIITDFSGMDDADESDTIVLGPSTTFVSSTFTKGSGTKGTLKLTVAQIYDDSRKGLTTKGTSTITLNNVENTARVALNGDIISGSGDAASVVSEATVVYAGTKFDITDSNSDTTMDFSRSWGVVTIDASAATAASHIIANKNNNSIIAGKSLTEDDEVAEEALTLEGGLGNDTLVGNTDAKIVYVYNANGTSHDGSDVIVGFKADDTLLFTNDASVDNNSFTVDAKTGDVKVQVYTTNAAGNTVKAGIITLKNAKDIDVNYKVGNATATHTGKQRATTDYVVTAETVAANKNDTISLADTDYRNKTLIDASSEYVGDSTQALWITPNTAGKATILGTANDDTIEGRGRATIDGGAGADVFLFDTSMKGAAVEIINYESDSDVIALGENVSISAVTTVKGAQYLDGTTRKNHTDLKLTLVKTVTRETATVTIKEVENTPKINVSIIGGDNAGLSKITYNTNKLVVADGDGAKIDVSADKLVSTIDASAANGTTYIIGNANANSIVAGGAENATVTVDGGAGNDIIIGSKENVSYSLIGGAGNDTLSLAAAASGSTLDGGAGNDLLIGSNNADVFVASAGNNSVRNYQTTDKVYIGNASVKSAAIASNGVTFTAGSNKITIERNSSTTWDTVTFFDESGLDTYVYYHNSDVTLTEVKNADLTLSTNVKRATAGADADRSGGAYTITANKNGTTMIGGKGDTMIGAAGNDVFVYNGSDDLTIKNYVAGKDVISLAGSIAGMSMVDTTQSGNQDIILTSDGGGHIIIKDAVTVANNGRISKLPRITVIEGNTTSTREYGVDYINIIPKDYDTDVTVTTALADLNSAVTKVNASKWTSNGVSITGNSIETITSQSLVGSAKDDTIISSGNNVTITGGKGKDIFSITGGSAYITDYAIKDGDTIGTTDDISNIELSGNDLIMTVGSSAATVTIKGGKGKEIKVNNETKIYGANSITTTVDVNLSEVWAKYTTVVSAKGSANISIDAGGRTDTLKITGSTGNDTIITGGASTVDGGKGNDVISLSGGGRAVGGDGNDTIISTGNATVDGGAGNDEITYTNGNGKVIGGAGNDSITVTGGSDYNVTVDGGAGDDVIEFNASGKVIGGAGNDKITVSGSGVVTVEAGAGNDEINLDNNNAIVRYGGGNDTITGSFTDSNRLILSGTKYNYDVENKRIKISNSAYIAIDLNVTDSQEFTNIVSGNRNVTLTAVDANGKKLNADSYVSSKAWFLNDDNNYTSNAMTPETDDIFSTNSISSLLKTNDLGELNGESNATDPTVFNTTYSNGDDKNTLK